jgi:hypothetical protein
MKPPEARALPTSVFEMARSTRRGNLSKAVLLPITTPRDYYWASNFSGRARSKCWTWFPRKSQLLSGASSWEVLPGRGAALAGGPAELGQLRVGFAVDQDILGKQEHLGRQYTRPCSNRHSGPVKGNRDPTHSRSLPEKRGKAGQALVVAHPQALKPDLAPQMGWALADEGRLWTLWIYYSSKKRLVLSALWN